MSEKFHEPVVGVAGRSGHITIEGTSDSDIESAMEELLQSGKGWVITLSNDRCYATTTNEFTKEGEDPTYKPFIFRIIRRGDGHEDKTTTLRRVRNLEEIRRIYGYLENLEEENRNNR